MKAMKMEAKASFFAENIHPHAVEIRNLNDDTLIIRNPLASRLFFKHISSSEFHRRTYL